MFCSICVSKRPIYIAYIVFINQINTLLLFIIISVIYNNSKSTMAHNSAEEIIHKEEKKYVFKDHTFDVSMYTDLKTLNNIVVNKLSLFFLCLCCYSQGLKTLLIFFVFNIIDFFGYNVFD